MKAIFVIISWLFYGTLTASGQLHQTARAELPVKSDYTSYEAWPQPDSTVLVLHTESFYRRNQAPYTLHCFDKDLRQLWQNALPVPKGTRFLSAAFDKKISYLLFKGNKESDLMLALVNNQTGQSFISNHVLPDNITFNLTNFSVLNGYLFLTGTQNQRQILLFLNPDLPELQILPALYEQSARLTEILADSAANRLEYVLAESNGKLARLQVKRLAPDGRLMSLNFIHRPDRNFLAARLAPGDSTAKLVAGSYSLRDLRYAQGFFTGFLNSEVRKQFKFYDFTTFSHYFDYLRPNRQLRLRQKIARFQVAQKVMHLRQRILLHALQPYQNGFLLLGELYIPHYSGQASNRVFDGYEQTSAIIAAFDKEGNLRWENSFPLQNQRFLEPQETVMVAAMGEQVLLAFVDEHKIRYKLLHNSETTPNDQQIELTSLQERINSTEIYGLKAWHHNHILTYGEQQVRGKNGLRRVFFLSRLSVAL